MKSRKFTPRQPQETSNSCMTQSGEHLRYMYHLSTTNKVHSCIICNIFRDVIKETVNPMICNQCPLRNEQISNATNDLVSMKNEPRLVGDLASYSVLNKQSKFKATSSSGLITRCISLMNIQLPLKISENSHLANDLTVCSPEDSRSNLWLLEHMKMQLPGLRVNEYGSQDLLSGNKLGQEQDPGSSPPQIAYLANDFQQPWAIYQRPLIDTFTYICPGGGEDPVNQKSSTKLQQLDPEQRMSGWIFSIVYWFRSFGVTIARPIRMNIFHRIPDPDFGVNIARPGSGYEYSALACILLDQLNSSHTKENRSCQSQFMLSNFH